MQFLCSWRNQANQTQAWSSDKEKKTFFSILWFPCYAYTCRVRVCVRSFIFLTQRTSAHNFWFRWVKWMTIHLIVYLIVFIAIFLILKFVFLFVHAHLVIMIKTSSCQSDKRKYKRNWKWFCCALRDENKYSLSVSLHLSIFECIWIWIEVANNKVNKKNKTKRVKKSIKRVHEHTAKQQ